MSEPQPELVQHAQAGDRAAMAELVTSQQRYVYSVAMSLMRNQTDAADLTQEAFLRLIRSLGSYRAETRFTTWLYRLVVNLGLDELRRRQRRGDPLTLDDDEAPEIPDLSTWSDPLRRAIGDDDALRVRAAVQELPVGQRLALTFHYFEDLSYDEIAQVMGVPLNTVKSYIRRGKLRLATALADTPASGATARPAEPKRRSSETRPSGPMLLGFAPLVGWTRC